MHSTNSTMTGLKRKDSTDHVPVPIRDTEATIAHVPEMTDTDQDPTVANTTVEKVTHADDRIADDVQCMNYK